MGHSRSGGGDVLGAFEFIRIARGSDGTLAYIAQPQGGAPVAFRAGAARKCGWGGERDLRKSRA